MEQVDLFCGTGRLYFGLENIVKIVLWHDFIEIVSDSMRDTLLELESMDENEFEDVRDAGWVFVCNKTGKVIESFEELVKVIAK